VVDCVCGVLPPDTSVPARLVPPLMRLRERRGSLPHVASPFACAQRCCGVAQARADDKRSWTSIQRDSAGHRCIHSPRR
jgi:hypothetical protein